MTGFKGSRIDWLGRYARTSECAFNYSKQFKRQKVFIDHPLVLIFFNSSMIQRFVWSVRNSLRRKWHLVLQERQSCYRQHSHKLQATKGCNRCVQRRGFRVSTAEVWLWNEWYECYGFAEQHMPCLLVVCPLLLIMRLTLTLMWVVRWYNKFSINFTKWREFDASHSNRRWFRWKLFTTPPRSPEAQPTWQLHELPIVPGCEGCCSQDKLRMKTWLGSNYRG